MIRRIIARGAQCHPLLSEKFLFYIFFYSQGWLCSVAANAAASVQTGKKIIPFNFPWNALDRACTFAGLPCLSLWSCTAAESLMDGWGSCSEVLPYAEGVIHGDSSIQVECRGRKKLSAEIIIKTWLNQPQPPARLRCMSTQDLRDDLPAPPSPANYHAICCDIEGYLILHDTDTYFYIAA